MSSFVTPVDEKLGDINRCLHKLMIIAEKEVKKGRYNGVFSALSAYCKIQYSINQVYTDQKAEDLVLSISERIVKIPAEYKSDKNTVLFYDGFGLDLRGWAATLVKALSGLGYNLVLVEPLRSRGKIPHLEMELKKGTGKIEYIKTHGSFLDRIQQLNKLFVDNAPRTAFFYTTPSDVVGTTVFDAYADKVNRVQIDLTDHAFWLGVKAFDITLDARMLGASNMVYNRGVETSKIRRIDFCPYVLRDDEQIPFPFNIIGEKFFFSGGALYKTLGDKQKLYYQIVDSILAQNTDTKFIYIGEGDTNEVVKLIEKYPNRVYYLHERKDFIQLYRHCVFYLNTYPMFGGLMMRYAALFGKVPVTLKHGTDHEGILLEQEKRGIEFDTYEEVIEEANRLLTDEQYRKRKEEMLSGACISEEDFARNLRMLIEEGQTEFSFDHIEYLDTSEFRAEYLRRIKNAEDVLVPAIATKSNIALVKDFPLLFIKRAIRRLKS